jgi:hypothetical protein
MLVVTNGKAAATANAMARMTARQSGRNFMSGRCRCGSKVWVDPIPRPARQAGAKIVGMFPGRVLGENQMTKDLLIIDKERTV